MSITTLWFHTDALSLKTLLELTFLLPRLKYSKGNIIIGFTTLRT